MERIQKIFDRAFTTLGERLSDFMPNLVVAVIILAAGLIAASVLRFLVSRLSAAMDLEGVSERLGVNALIKEAGIPEYSTRGLVSAVVYWLTIALFCYVALVALNVPAADRLFERFVMYLPNIFIAVVVVVAGFALSNFISRAVLIASVNAGIASAGLLRGLVRYLIIFLSVSMALEQLGIGKETVVIFFSVVLGGTALALAIAFGLGGKDIARQLIEEYLKSKKEESKGDDIEHM